MLRTAGMRDNDCWGCGNLQLLGAVRDGVAKKVNGQLVTGSPGIGLRISMLAHEPPGL
jgi:hypothetical protein